jgi:hypothetical protein
LFCLSRFLKVLLIFLAFCVVLWCVFTFVVLSCDVRYAFGIKTMFVFTSSFFVGELMSYLHYLCLFSYSGIQHTLCCVFVLFVLCLVYPMLPVSLDCPFLIAPSVSLTFIFIFHIAFFFRNTCFCFLNWSNIRSYQIWRYN